MTQDDIIEMAREAGIEEAFDLKYDQVLVQFKNGSLERFAKLVAAKEREACAKVCDDIHAVYNKPEDTAERVASQWCGERIRARGQ